MTASGDSESERLVLVLLPGMDGTGRLFAPLVAALGDGADALVLDLPADRPLGYDALLRGIEERLPSRRIVVLAESFSGPLAVRLAAKRKEVVGLVLCASFVRPPRARAFLRISRLVARGVPPRLAVRGLLTGFDAPRELVEDVRAAVRSLAPGVLRERLRAVHDVDVSGALAETTCPLLYLAADRDRLVKDAALAGVRNARADVEVHRFDGPHLLAQTRAKEVAAVLRRFLARCS